MEVDSSTRGVPLTDERPRTAQSYMKDTYDGPKYNYDSAYASDQGPGPATMETTPPRFPNRPRPRFNTRIPQRDLQERERSDCLSGKQTIDLFERKLEEARKETQDVLSGTDEVADTIKPTLTIDLGRARIGRLPDAIIEMIIADVERLSLSHNSLRLLPTRIHECKQLRYLNIRSNDFTEIPPSIYEMPFLEILDVSKNKIQTIPSSVGNLQALRVFSIVHNRLRDLPMELTDLPRLKVLKIGENQFRPPIQRVIRDKEQEVAFSAMTENERDTELTTEIIKYLKRIKPPSANTAVQDGGEASEPSSAVESTRFTRRAFSGRFPVVPAALTSEPLPDASESLPLQSKPPNLPTKSHLRGLSGQSNHSPISKRPNGPIPAVNGNERNRSNSEGVAPGGVPAHGRSKRMGMLNANGLDSIDETKVIRQSHLRGFSYASALRRNGSISSPTAASSSPSSPRDTRKDRPHAFVRRMSSLPEQKSDQTRRPLIEGAKGVLYALYQVHPHIHGLISASRGNDNRRSALDIAFFHASSNVDKLNKSLEYTATLDPEDDTILQQQEDRINADCVVCIKGFVNFTVQMQETTHKIVATADPRYVRTLMLLLYGSIVEIRNAITNFGVEVRHHRRQMSSGNTHQIHTIPEEPVPATPQKPQSRHSPAQSIDELTLRQPTRYRSHTVMKVPSSTDVALQPVQPPALRIPETVSIPPPVINGTYRSASAMGQSSNRSFASRSRSNSRNLTYVMNGDMQSAASTPRSADSYNLPSMPTVNSQTGSDTTMTDSQEEQRFEIVFSALTRAYETALQSIPITIQQLERCLDAAKDQQQPKSTLDIWHGLLQKSRQCHDLSQALQIRLTNMKMKDSGVGLSSTEGGRHDPSFWVLCKTFMSSFVSLLTEMKEVRKARTIVIPQEAVGVLRPVQKACQEAGHSITTSPWNHLLEGVGNMPAPTPFVAKGTDYMTARPVYNRSATIANSNVSSYSSALVHHQITQAQNPHYPPNSKLQLRPPQNSLSSLPVHTLPTPTSVNGASPLSAASTVPSTPLSAALGAAAQATVPSTPASLYGDSFFQGNVFQRADSLLNMPQAAGINFLNRR